MTDTAPGWDRGLADRQLRCERCGTVFGCRNLSEGDACWCALEPDALPVPLPVGAGPYEDCLCPRCLRELAADLRARGHGPRA